jgi:hypothetical protein
VRCHNPRLSCLAWGRGQNRRAPCTN